MSESDIMFNERDRRCAAVQPMLFIDPSYDNRTIASTHKMQIWVAMNNRDMPRVMKTKFPATVMVFGVVSSEGHIMPPNIFEVGLKVNTKVYLDVLKSVVILWYNQVAGGRPWVWQQDLAPSPAGTPRVCHRPPDCTRGSPHSSAFGTGLQVQRDPGLASEGVLRLCTLLSLPPSSPDLNPLDYFLWSYVENITNMTYHYTKASLIAAIRRVFTQLLPVLVEKACSQFRIRIEAVIEAEGGYIE